MSSTKTSHSPRIHYSFVTQDDDEDTGDRSGSVAIEPPSQATSDRASATPEVREIVLGRSRRHGTRSLAPPPAGDDDDDYNDEDNDDEDNDDEDNDDEDNDDEDNDDDDESQESRPPKVGETDIKLMDLYPVHSLDRTVEATITSDGDSLTVTSTDLSDVTASIITSDGDAGCFVFHSAMSANRMHTNTRYNIFGTRNQFDMRRYGKPCASAALTKFRNLELFRVSSGSISFIVSVYIIHERIPKYPRFFDIWVSVLCCAFNVARMKPSLFPSYRTLSNKMKSQYREAMSTMLPFECLKGDKLRKAEIKDTVTDVPHAIGSAFISVFWEVLKRWAELPEDLADDQKDAENNLYGFDKMPGLNFDASTVLEDIPVFARHMTKSAIFSARAVGTKSAWLSKPCSLVSMNDAQQVRDTLVAHTAIVHGEAKRKLTCVEKEGLYIALDIGHHVAPILDYTSFMFLGHRMARYAKEATARTTTSEKRSREGGSNSAGESAQTVPF
jgi:hypothetical protein